MADLGAHADMGAVGTAADNPNDGDTITVGGIAFTFAGGVWDDGAGHAEADLGAAVAAAAAPAPQVQKPPPPAPPAAKQWQDPFGDLTLSDGKTVVQYDNKLGRAEG